MDFDIVIFDKVPNSDHIHSFSDVFIIVTISLTHRRDAVDKDKISKRIFPETTEKQKKLPKRKKLPKGRKKLPKNKKKLPKRKRRKNEFPSLKRILKKLEQLIQTIAHPHFWFEAYLIEAVCPTYILGTFKHFKNDKKH